MNATNRDLRDHAAELLERVKTGERATITHGGVPVAELVPIDEPSRRRSLPAAELLRRLETTCADPGLRDDLARLAGETTGA